MSQNPKECRFVPKLTRNLVSLGIFDDSGYINKIKGGAMRISKEEMIVIKGYKIDGLYHLIGDTMLGTTAEKMSFWRINEQTCGTSDSITSVTK